MRWTWGRARGKEWKGAGASPGSLDHGSLNFVIKCLGAAPVSADDTPGRPLLSFFDSLDILTVWVCLRLPLVLPEGGWQGSRGCGYAMGQGWNRA